MTPAFDRHPLVGQIVADWAWATSTAPASEAVIPSPMAPCPTTTPALARRHGRARRRQSAAAPFAAVEYMTVRDDAGPAMREAATAELRAKVEAQVAAGRQVLVVPHVTSFGGIEQGIRKRLDGLHHTMADQGLIPDPRVLAWLQDSVTGRPEGGVEGGAARQWPRTS